MRGNFSIRAQESRTKGSFHARRAIRASPDFTHRGYSNEHRGSETVGFLLSQAATSIEGCDIVHD
jgi:hypothetical protein